MTRALPLLSIALAFAAGLALAVPVNLLLP
jgi:hypothetical protein